MAEKFSLPQFIRVYGQNPLPTRAEVNDIYNTLLDNADDLVLAAETAIGAYHVECTSMVVKILAFENPAHNKSLSFLWNPYPYWSHHTGAANTTICVIRGGVSRHPPN